MDRYTQAVISLLENHQAVHTVEHKPQPPCNLTDIVAWQSRNSLQKLPPDLESFFYVSNGFSLQWKGLLRGLSFPVGNLHVNSVRDMVSIEIDHWPEDDLNNSFIVGKGRKKPRNKQKKGSAKKAPTALSPRAAFDLDSTCTCGVVALMYLEGEEQPSVWFQDLACNWSFIANSFSDYFRLMLTHQGVPNWQGAFTPAGLDPSAREWLRFLTPGPLPIDGSLRRATANQKRRPRTSRPISARGARAVNIGEEEKNESGEEAPPRTVISAVIERSSVRPTSASSKNLIWRG